MPIVRHSKFIEKTEHMIKEIAKDYFRKNYGTPAQVKEDYFSIITKIIFHPLTDDYEDYLSSYTEEDMRDIKLILLSHDYYTDYTGEAITREMYIHALHFHYSNILGTMYMIRLIDNAYEYERERRLQTPKQVIRRSTRSR